ncbi:uncharacterized protein YALI1_A08835g [Yarrowia lipolytica]|uniref:Uncharacterized protein n=1 Tax=Yarrowia lipolytica TaxID=4952 RepID=A0A1D8N469_YARLL|nr:hypothetical protein YALI1_A08835g [Yarrowia lipolytica]
MCVYVFLDPPPTLRTATDCWIPSTTSKRSSPLVSFSSFSSSPLVLSCVGFASISTFQPVASKLHSHTLYPFKAISNTYFWVAYSSITLFSFQSLTPTPLPTPDVIPEPPTVAAPPVETFPKQALNIPKLECRNAPSPKMDIPEIYP